MEEGFAVFFFYVAQSSHNHRDCKWVWEESNGVICSRYSQHHDVSELHTERSCLLPSQVCDVLDFYSGESQGWEAKDI